MAPCVVKSQEIIRLQEEEQIIREELLEPQMTTLKSLKAQSDRCEDVTFALRLEMLQGWMVLQTHHRPHCYILKLHVATLQLCCQITSCKAHLLHFRQVVHANCKRHRVSIETRENAKAARHA